MYTGKLVFAQALDFLPLHTFRRCVQRYDGNRYIKSFSCQDQYRCMAFAQLAYRESLRDIEVCLKAQRNKLYHMGMRTKTVARSTLANANEKRDWRIFADFAQSLIQVVRPLYADEDLGLQLDSTVYALDSTTIDLCLSVFPWARFRQTKAAVKLHTLLDLQGNIPTFIHISDGKLHDVNVLDLLLPEPAAFYVMDRGYLDFERLYQIHGTDLRSDHHVDWLLYRSTLSGKTSTDKIYRSKDLQTIRLSNQQFFTASIDHHRALSLPLAGRTVFQMDQTTPAHQIIFRHIRERCEDTGLDRRIRLCSGRYHQEATQSQGQFVFNSTNFKPDCFRNNANKSTTYRMR